MIIMNANPSSAASVGVSPNVERLQGTPALQPTADAAMGAQDRQASSETR